MRVVALPTWATLYSLLHLNGFPGDTAFYRGACAGDARVLELGAGDGRVGEVLCAAAGIEYVGVELCDEFVASATERLSPYTRARVVVGDMLTRGVGGDEPFDAVLLTANTFFCTPEHGELLVRCREALRPGGRLLFDVYNARDWHEEALHGPREAGADDGAVEEGGEDLEEESEVLVLARDVDGREWTVYEREPEVDAEKRVIRCTYDYHAATGERAPRPLISLERFLLTHYTTQGPAQRAQVRAPARARSLARHGAGYLRTPGAG